MLIDGTDQFRIWDRFVLYEAAFAGDKPMTITLTIVNADSLPKGAPAFYRATRRGFHVGRDEHVDWTLPDPFRHISARHCEVRFENGGYWLHDQSTNGVYLNGSSERMKSPARLVHGDRLAIGRYIVEVAIEEEMAGRPVFGIAPSERSETGSKAEAPQGEPPSPVERGPQSGEASEAHAHAAGHVPDAGMAEETEPASGSRRPEAEELFEALLRGAGIDPQMLVERDPNALAFEIGEFVKLTVEHLGELLSARAAAKAMVKNSSRTMLGTRDNNPLKLIPGSAEAIEAMFARRRTGYLDARHSLEEAFADLRGHEIATYTAMQKALARLLDPLAPEGIETRVSGSAFGPRKARAWDLFVQRWEERNADENGMLDAFLAYFAEAYDEAVGKK